MDRLTQLQEQKNNLATRMKEIGEKLDENGNWPDNTVEQNWKDINADYDKVLAEMESAQNAINVQNRLESLADNDPPHVPTNSQGAGQPPQSDRFGGDRRTEQQVAAQNRSQALDGWFRTGDNRTARNAGFKIENGDLELPLFNGDSYRQAQQYAQSGRSGQPTNAVFTTGTGATGGFTIPAESLVQRLEMAMLYYGGMRQNATSLRTSHGETIQLPTVNDTGNTGVLLAESADAFNSGSGGATGTFAQVSLDAHKYSSQAFVIPYELLEDTHVDLIGYVGDALGERLGRVTNNAFTVADGSSKPNGIVSASALGVTAAAAAAIAADEIIDLQHSVDIAYRTNAAFMMADATCALIRKLKDGDSNYLWQPSYQQGVPDRLAGSRVVINNDMPAATTGLKSVIYGDLSKYIIRTVNSVRFRRLDERYADKDQVGFIAFVREDGNLLDAGVDPVKHLIQA